MQAIPTQPGAYAIQFSLPQATALQVGRLGKAHLPAGEYVYLGSGCGPGGLRARLGRHLGAPPPKRRWHVDYLHSIAQARACCYLLFPAVPHREGEQGISITVECLWSQALAALPGASIPVPGFGASDCRAGCRAHLVAFPREALPDTALLITPKVRLVLAQASILAPDALNCEFFA